MKTQAELELLGMAELVALHNENVPEDKAVKKFADKTVAVRRTLQALARKNVDKAAEKAKTPVDRSAAIAASWKDPATAAARASRISVRARGTNYKSVADAFKALELPLSRHIKFRGDLRKAGELDFKFQDADGKNQSVKFKVVEIAQPAAA